MLFSHNLLKFTIHFVRSDPFLIWDTACVTLNNTSFSRITHVHLFFSSVTQVLMMVGMMLTMTSNRLSNELSINLKKLLFS